jgi:hypothetical protein
MTQDTPLQVFVAQDSVSVFLVCPATAVHGSLELHGSEKISETFAGKRLDLPGNPRKVGMPDAPFVLLS